MTISTALLGQKQASDPTANVWVGASAGTGKTKVLTDRILRILLMGCSPDRILCLTFTKAAAAEMSNRLTHTLAIWATLGESELVKEIEQLTGTKPIEDQISLARQLFLKVLDTPSGMKIQTIHSFCQSILSQFPLEAGITPHFQIMDDLQAEDLLKRAQDKVLSHTEDPLRLKALQILNLHMSDFRFSDLMAEFHSNRSRFQEVLEGKNLQDLVDQIKEDLTCEKGIDLLEEAVRDRLIIQFGGNSLLPETDTDLFLRWKNSPEDRPHLFNDFCQFFLTQKGEIRKKLSSVYQAEAERLCHFLESLKSLELAQKTVAFLIIAHAILQRYQVEKQKLSFLDYDDLIHLTAQLLQQPGYASWILYKLDGGIDHILVDEAQDTNQQQWQVIQTLVSEFLTPDKLQRSLFVVGDSKQSIYSFQGADPKDFYRLKKQFSDYTQSLGKKWKDISLSVSFRSAPAILMAVDAVFSDPTRRSIITVDSQEVCHLPARSSASGLVEFWPIIMPEPQEKEEEPWPLPIIHYPNVTSKKRLAALVAEKIEGLLASHSILAATKQVIQPRDILVLVRKRSEFVDFLTKELRRRLIPVSGSDRLSFTDHLAVKDLIALGQFLLLPDDDLALACLLKSPLIGISEEVLFDLSYKRQGTLWAEMIRRQRDFPLIQEGYQLLADLLDKVDVISPYELYHMVFTRYQGKRRFLERLGRDCEDVLDEFLGMATSFQQSKGESLQAFIQYLITKTHIIKRDTADLQHNQVRIMTVHGSKGLQAPIVILPEDVCPRSKTDFFLWDISPYNKAEMVYLRPSSELDTPHTRLLKNRIQRDAEAEELRLLYVALTRAQDRLYLCGSSESRKDPSPQSWYEIVRKALSDRLYPGDGGVYRYEPIPSQKIIAQSGFRNPDIPLPNWVKTAPILPAYAEKAPSKRGTNAAMERGVLIHGLFELLPDFPERQWCDVAAAYLGSQGQDVVLFKEDIQKVITILKDPRYASFFSDNSQSEVSITAVVDGETILGRIDRLCITETEITILDYKTGEIPTSEKEIPSSYRQQLLTYGRILSALYPDHKCRLMLLWTEGPLIMEMSMDS